MSILKVSFLVALVVAAAAAAPVDDPIPIVSQSQDGPNPDGSYSWNYETANGIKAQEQGHLEPSKDSADQVAMKVEGSYSYVNSDGSEGPIALTYIADENGFQPRGEHLPTPPPIPSAILRALEWIANHPEEDDIRK